MKHIKATPRLLTALLLCNLVLITLPVQRASADPGTAGKVFLPAISAGGAAVVNNMAPRINTPYFGNDSAMDHYYEMAIFWLGKVQHPLNYADVRVGYNDTGITINLNIFDKRLWYDDNPTAGTYSEWDSISLYVDVNDSNEAHLSGSAYRFDAMLSWWEPRLDYQHAYRGNGQDWILKDIPFNSTSGWRGNSPNDDIDDRGWSLTYEIPFTSLGLTSPPSQGKQWGLGLQLFDRDDSSGTPVPPTNWPDGTDPQTPSSWGILSFGLPIFQRPAMPQAGTTVIRQGLNGASVVDGEVGGHTTCGQGLDFWTTWGNQSYPHYVQVNIQNQADVADFPCFSKFYLTFPLDQIPSNKAILDATLTMHLFGNSDPSGAYPSLIQVLTVKEDWNESSLTWNNAPIADENVSLAWVEPISSYPGWPGIPYTWDLSRAVSRAYARGESLRLVLYSADSAMHSGKYFLSSDEEPLNAVARPTLDVTWGNP